MLLTEMSSVGNTGGITIQTDAWQTLDSPIEDKDSFVTIWSNGSRANLVYRICVAMLQTMLHLIEPYMPYLTQLICRRSLYIP